MLILERILAYITLILEMILEYRSFIPERILGYKSLILERILARICVDFDDFNTRPKFSFSTKTINTLDKSRLMQTTLHFSNKDCLYCEKAIILP